MRNIRVTEYISHIMELQVKPADLCIDATMGNGHDTLKLAELVGGEGSVEAFDIQQTALTNTKKRLDDAGLSDRVNLHLTSHEYMSQYVKEESASLAVFNFGYLPGGDHNLATSAKSSLKAINEALKLVRKGGIVLLCIYSGGDSGFEERDAILDMIKNLDSRKFLVMKTEYYNRANNPPIPVVIVKL